MFSVTEGTPSPGSKKKLQKKFKPRDSGVVLSDEEDAQGDGEGYLGVSVSGRASSTSVSTEGDTDTLVTPGVGPSLGSGWPVIVSGDGVHEGRGVGNYEAGDLKTLAAGARAPEGGSKKVPGTPVKKVKMRVVKALGGRPWQSVVAKKVGVSRLTEWAG